jgi:putative Holliday junction resolvase
MSGFLIKNLKDIALGELLSSGSVVAGLDVGDKNIGVAVSDQQIMIASGISRVVRGWMVEKDCELISETLKFYKIGLIIFGWPLQMNGVPGEQCKKVLKFMEKLAERLPVCYAKWDERFSSCVVDGIMIKADLSRKKRKKFMDKTAAVYILQGALDFLNRRLIPQEI